MERNRTSELLGILQQHYNPREEGWMWVAVRPPYAERGALNQVEGEPLDPVTMVRSWSEILSSLGPVEVFIAICRRGGRPHEADRHFWRGMRNRFDGTETVLIDLVAFNHDEAWSMREEDAQSNAVA
jgi:hypothetical protein